MNQSMFCGAQVGFSGNTGDSTAAHLHFELRNGLNVSNTSRDPFAGTESQSTEYWYQFTLVTDPLNPSNQIHYPTFACQP
jgi:murein DD-endopeptidase MepM/ murein hydrolase activator NlpD